MDSVQSSIRAKVKLGEFPAPKGAEAFSAYAIAWRKRLFLEMENAARQTLDLPMTFEILGEDCDYLMVGHCATLPTSASAAETTLSHPSTHSSKSNLQGLQAFGLVVQKSCLLSEVDQMPFSPDG